ncbi:MAG: heterodisulfide reductase-related iron-sulfur binding cluster [Halobacteriota archaeon]
MYSLAQVAPDVTRPTFWQIGPAGELVFYYLAAVAIAIFLYGSYERVRSFAAGPADPIDRLDDLGRRVVTATKIVASNEKQFDRDWYGGLMHTLIFWGFLTLLVGTTILAIDMDVWTKLLGQPSFFVGAFYLSFSFVMDALGFLFVVGIGMALYRRYWIRNDRLWGKHTGPEDDLFVWSLFLLGVGGFLQEGIRILGMGMPDYEVVSFVGWTVANSLAAAGVSEAGATAAYGPLWWSHAVIALVFIAAVPYAKPLHMLTSFANVVTRDEQAGTRLPGVPEDASPEEIGFTGLEDMSWKQRLDQDACTKCGRCSSVCPAAESGRPLDPRDVILDLKEYRHAVENGEAEEMDIVSAQGESVIDSETMEACMTCMACMDACPVEIEHVPQFTEMNRRLTETGQMDENVQEAMMNVFQNGNSFGEPERKRPDWTDDLDFEIPDAREETVEYLWYVGDYPSYDDRNKTVARALARIFEAADVSYGILYEDEKNDGNDVRRVGEEGLFEMLAEENIETLEAADFETLVTTDPHSFNTFRNEYEDFGWENGDSVHHYTQVVEDLIQEGALPLSASDLDRTVTFHDPCHLGRYNDEFEAPRAVLDSTGVTVDEMPRNKSDSFCCGGGGGGLWMDADEDVKPSEERIREALEDTRAGDDVEQFVVSCPMCMTMYEDGRKTGGYEDDIEVVDLAELVWEALEGEQSAAGEPVAAD